MVTTRAAGITAAAGTGLARPFLQMRFKHLDSPRVRALGVPLSRFPAL
jgi:hypothetical protein